MKYCLKLNNFLIPLILVSTFISCGTKEKKETSTTPVGRTLEFPNELSFLDNSGNEITTLRYLSADTPDKRNQGLMNVPSMPEDAGMVFFFDTEEVQSFWMVNTPLSLDIIYVAADSTIVTVYHSTTPFSEQSLPSFKPAKFVVETNAGYCINNDIKEGVKIKF